MVLATGNPGKLREFGRLLAGRVELAGLAEVAPGMELEEPGTTYEENARAKAEAVARATGLPALADDSGIEVPGLGGWPGPHSARWLGPDASDRDRLLGLLARVAAESPQDSRARYVAAVALATPGRDTVIATGSCSGTLVDSPRGEGGFGYDPAFLSGDLGITFGEADDAAKDGVSHRARALRQLVDAGVLGRL